LRRQRAHGLTYGSLLLGRVDGHLIQSICGFYRLACSESCALRPRRPPWRRWPGQAISPKAARSSRPWLGIRQCAAWACEPMPNASGARFIDALLPAGPRSAACNAQDPCPSERAARPSALGVRRQLAYGLIYGFLLLGRLDGHLIQSICGFYRLPCSEQRTARCDLEGLRGAAGPRGPPARRLHVHRAHGLVYGSALLGRANGYHTHPACGLHSRCCPQAHAVMCATPKTLVDPSVERGRQP
jgi:hypothetical protein